MEIKIYLEKLNELGACREAVEWSGNYAASQEAWEACENGAWMLWLVKRTMLGTDAALRKLTLTKARWAKLVLHLMKDDRSKNAVLVAEKFGMGMATLDELDAAAAAYAAACAAAYAAADRLEILKRCADIVRADYSNVDELLAKI